MPSRNLPASSRISERILKYRYRKRVLTEKDQYVLFHLRLLFIRLDHSVRIPGMLRIFVPVGINLLEHHTNQHVLEVSKIRLDDLVLNEDPVILLYLPILQPDLRSVNCDIIAEGMH